MHITEGVAPASVAAAGAILAAGGVVAGLRAMKDEQIPRAAIMASAIFAASLLIRLPLGPSSVHPVLNGLAGLLLGWAAVPVFLVALFLQALLFQFGGITTLGLNTVVMGAPAVLCYYGFNRSLRRCGSARAAFWLGAAAGVTALLFSFLLWAGALVLSGKSLAVIVKLALVPHLAILGVEGAFTGFVSAFLFRVYPRAFEIPRTLGTGTLS